MIVMSEPRYDSIQEQECHSTRSFAFTLMCAITLTNTQISHICCASKTGESNKQNDLRSDLSLILESHKLSNLVGALLVSLRFNCTYTF